MTTPEFQVSGWLTSQKLAFQTFIAKEADARFWVLPLYNPKLSRTIVLALQIGGAMFSAAIQVRLVQNVTLEEIVVFVCNRIPFVKGIADRDSEGKDMADVMWLRVETPIDVHTPPFILPNVIAQSVASVFTAASMLLEEMGDRIEVRAKPETFLVAGVDPLPPAIPPASPSEPRHESTGSQGDR